jgi:predicted nucleic acid-binding protein
VTGLADFLRSAENSLNALWRSVTRPARSTSIFRRLSPRSATKRELVVDASVAAKWFLKDAAETDTDVAEDLLLAYLAGDIQLYGPGVFPYEVCSLLAKACGPQRGAGRIGKADAAQFARDFFQLGIPVHSDTDDHLVEAIEMSADHGKAHFDMSYVRLARELGTQWCTADHKAASGVPASISHLFIELASMRGAI